MKMDIVHFGEIWPSVNPTKGVRSIFRQCMPTAPKADIQPWSAIFRGLLGFAIFPHKSNCNCCNFSIYFFKHIKM